MIDPEQPIYTTKHIAEALGVTTQFVRAQVAAGLLHATTNRKHGKKRLLRFSLNDIVRYDHEIVDRVERSRVA